MAGTAEQFSGIFLKQRSACSIDEAQCTLRIEGVQRNVDLFDHTLQQLGRFGGGRERRGTSLAPQLHEKHYPENAVTPCGSASLPSLLTIARPYSRSKRSAAAQSLSPPLAALPNAT